MNKHGQGAMEYLLLLAAAIIVVAIVLAFMMNPIKENTEAGTQANYDFLCKTLDSNTLTCGCYLCDTTLGGYNEVTKTNNVMANQTACDALAIARNSPMLAWTNRCP